jgi:hypothetical protein
MAGEVLSMQLGGRKCCSVVLRSVLEAERERENVRENRLKLHNKIYSSPGRPIIREE